MNNLELFQVYNFDKKKRYGTFQEGSYIIAEIDGNYDSYLFSGISTEENLHDFIHNFNINRCNSFDVDIKISHYTNKNSFIKQNITPYSPDNGLYRLVDNYDNIFLKLGLNGDYQWVLNLTEAQLNQFKQIVIEIQGTYDRFNSNYNDKVNCLKKLSNTHYIVNDHDNAIGPIVNNLPDVFELTYVNKKYFDFNQEFNHIPFPIVNLEILNKIGFNNITLNFYPFKIDTIDMYNIQNGINNSSNITYPNYQKVIHITYKTLDKLEAIKKQWLDLNPDYSVELYDDAKCLEFLLENYGQKYCDIFNYIEDGPIKSDFFRLCILYIKGGIYVDADVKPLIPISDFIEDDVDFVTCLSYNYHPRKQDFNFNPHFIVTKKYNTFIYKTLKIYEMLYDNKNHYSYWHWSICYIIVIDIPIDIDILKCNFTHNGKKYLFLVENIFKDQFEDNVLWYNFKNFFDKNGKIKFDMAGEVVCRYNGIDVLKNFENKELLK